jgi:hypothetical protein
MSRLPKHSADVAICLGYLAVAWAAWTWAPTDPLATTLQVVLGLLGIAMSYLNDKTAEKHRIKLVGLLIVVTVLSALAADRSSNESQDKVVKAQRELSETQERLKQALDKTNELSEKGVALQEQTSKMQELNARLTERVLDTNREISRLAREGIEATTGGDGFARIILGPNNQMLLLLHGQAALSDISVTIFERDSRRLFGETKFIPMLPPDILRPIGEVPPSVTSVDWNIQYLARNGYWRQRFRAAKSGGAWVQATQVLKGPTRLGPTNREKERILFEEGDPKLLEP